MGERGYGSILALGLAFGGVLLVAVATDVSRLLITWRETSHLAHTAAETAAGWVEPGSVYRGELVIDVEASEAAAFEVASGPGRSVTVHADMGGVCVTVGRGVTPGLTRLVGGVSRTVAVTACAVPRRG